jgi:hypothetical protein
MARRREGHRGNQDEGVDKVAHGVQYASCSDT